MLNSTSIILTIRILTVKAYECTTFIGLAVKTALTSLIFPQAAEQVLLDDSSVDVLLVDAGDSYLAKVMTDKGAAWMNAAGFTADAGLRRCLGR